MKNWFKYKFDWMMVYFSPFKPIIPKLYIGKVAIGTPYFLPRVWGTNRKARPKKIGFDFVGHGWKTKWTSTDYRHEWNPVWSFVFFRWQIALIFNPIEAYHYWECWLYYSRHTSGKTKDRIKQARKEFPCVWTTNYSGEEKKTTCYWDIILKDKYNARYYNVQRTRL